MLIANLCLEMKLELNQEISQLNCDLLCSSELKQTSQNLDQVTEYHTTPPISSFLGLKIDNEQSPGLGECRIVS